MAWIIVAAVILVIVIRVVWELHHPKVTHYALKSEKLPAGCRVVFLSDLHLRRYGERNEELIGMVKKEQPDLILIGGDMTKKRGWPDESLLFALLKALAETAPVYYAPGNHESFLRELAEEEAGVEEPGRYTVLLEKCREYGIVYLSNKKVQVKAGGIEIAGLDLCAEYYHKQHPRKLYAEEITQMVGAPEEGAFTILLAHPPAHFEEYVKYGADLVLAGHYHGGAIRFGRAGFVSPQVKFFPKYSSGRFEKDGTTMIVTRGIGSHSVNLRLFNYPEVVVLELKK